MILLVFSFALFPSCGGGGTVVAPPPPPPPPPPPAPPPLVITAASLPDAIVGQNYNQSLQATGGTPPYTWSLAPGSSPLQPGLTLSGNGTISGVPTMAAGRGIDFQVRDSAGRTATLGLNLFVVDPLVLTNPVLRYGIITRSYTHFFVVTGGTFPYTWSVSPGSTLPPGLSITPTGFLAGNLAAAGTYDFTLLLQDSHGLSSPQSVRLDVFAEPLIATPSIDTVIEGQFFTWTFQAAGTPPFVWDIDPSGSLPNWATFTSNGVFSGTSNLFCCNWIIPIRVTDASGRSDTLMYNIRYIGQLRFPAGTVSLPDGNTELSYSHGLSLSGGQNPINLTVTAGAVPPGLSLFPGFSSASLSGTPTAPGVFNFTVQASDLLGQMATGDFTVLIKNYVIFLNCCFPSGLVSRAYPQQGFNAVGGVRPYAWSIASGALPPGLNLDPTQGLITGTPTSDGLYIFDVLATDSAVPPNVGQRQYSIFVRPVLSIQTTTFPDASANGSYNASILTTGGDTSSHNVRISAGQFPPGLIINTIVGYADSINIFGNANLPGTYNFTVEVTDGSSPPLVATRDFTIRVHPAFQLNSTTLSTTLEGQPFSHMFTATGGLPPYSWSAQFQPMGITMDPVTGVLNGTPTEAFSNQVRVTVTDSASPPQSRLQNFSWNVIGLLRIETKQLPAITRGSPVRVFPSVSGGICCPYSWSVSAGALPPGMTMTSPSGEISGTPNSSGTFSFTLRVADSPSAVITQSATLPLTWEVRDMGTLGRNDSIATATPLSNGRFSASISPHVDPIGPVANPDHDFYAVTADGGSVVTVETFADRLSPFSFMDSVIEIVDSAGTRLNTCDPFSSSGSFSSACLNDDHASVSTLDSRLFFKAPGTPGTPVTFYVRVLDWSGDARPDFRYEISITGAN